MGVGIGASLFLISLSYFTPPAPAIMFVSLATSLPTAAYAATLCSSYNLHEQLDRRSGTNSQLLRYETSRDKIGTDYEALSRKLRHRGMTQVFELLPNTRLVIGESRTFLSRIMLNQSLGLGIRSLNYKRLDALKDGEDLDDKSGPFGCQAEDRSTSKSSARAS